MLKEISLDNVVAKTIKIIKFCGEILGAFAKFSSQFQQRFIDFYNCCGPHQDSFRKAYNKSGEADGGINFRRYFR